MSELQRSLFDCAASDLCALVAEREGLSIKEAMRAVYPSSTYAKLGDPETGLYREGPMYLYELFCEERGRVRF